jgi:hypothetical protein
MLWFLERESEVLICEVRQAADGPQFELAVRKPGEPEQVERFDEPTRLIEEWLTRQRRYRELGWRPRA